MNVLFAILLLLFQVTSFAIFMKFNLYNDVSKSRQGDPISASVVSVLPSRVLVSRVVRYRRN